MSADTPRPIWLTQKQAQQIDAALRWPDWDELRQAVLPAWDAAPANPTEAAAKALRDTPKCGYWRNSEEGAGAVLRALGHKDAS